MVPEQDASEHAPTEFTRSGQPSPSPEQAPSAPWQGRVLPANTGEFATVEDLADQEDVRRRAERRLWWQWVLFTACAWVVATGVIALVGRFFPLVRAEDEGWEYLLYLVAGMVQARLLRRYFPHAQWWAVITALAAALAVLLHLLLFAGPVALWSGADRAARDAVTTLLDLMLIAGAQWLWLRPRVERARRWLISYLVPAVLLALLSFLGGGGAASTPTEDQNAVVLVIAAGFVSLLLTVPTGSALIRLLRHPTSSPLAPVRTAVSAAP